YLTTTEALIADHAIIIGNAAHGLHPVAGQGFNLGLRDAATLAEVVADAIANPAEDVASLLQQKIPEVQKNYCEWRHNDQQNVVRFTDGLIRFFSTSNNMVGIMRGLTLLGFDLLPTAKRSLARYAMGLGGRMTKLARGVKPELANSSESDS
ncbi:MAG: FAD-dependent monooxygenase, partial [Gammaproteobacteria bacterium]|nr:FAD-dependent monooxygenase [Gammaproteobacteria bacterium]